MRGSISAPRCAYAYNLLDNSDFTNPINQRGNTSYTGYSFAIDRWSTWSPAGTPLPTLTINKGSVTIGFAIYQNIISDPYKTYTLAAMLDTGLHVISGVPANDISDGKIRIQAANEAVVEASIRNGATAYWAALYEGAYTAETLPTYHPKGYAAELAECQRYFLPVNQGSVSLYVGFGVAASDTVIYVSVPTPTTMRTPPSVAEIDASKLTLSGEGGVGWIAVTAVRGSFLYGNCIVLELAANGMAAGKIYGLIAASPFALSSDL